MTDKPKINHAPPNHPHQALSVAYKAERAECTEAVTKMLSGECDCCNEFMCRVGS